MSDESRLSEERWVPEHCVVCFRPLACSLVQWLPDGCAVHVRCAQAEGRDELLKRHAAGATS